MGKDNSKKLVGQPLLKQIIKMLPKDEFDLLVAKCGSDRYYKTFFSWEQLIVMLFGIFSRCDSMGEVCDGMRALGGKLNYLGMDLAPAKSKAGDALRDRHEELFRLYYFFLIAYFPRYKRSSLNYMVYLFCPVVFQVVEDNYLNAAYGRVIIYVCGFYAIMGVC